MSSPTPQPRYATPVLALLLLATLLCALIAPVAPIAAQGDPSQEVLREVLSFLSKQVGRPIRVLDNYTFELKTFPDSSFGCPQPGKTPEPKPTQGYRFLITVRGVTYDVRSTLDGTRAVLCANPEIKQVVSLAVYRSTAFSIPYPDRWSATDRETDIYFGLGPNPVCAEPGMTVSVMSKVEPGKDIDRLLTDHLASVRGAVAEKDRITIRNIGRSILYMAPCTDGSPRQFRASLFSSYGRAFLVLQFAPREAFGQWADIYLKILGDFAPSAVGVNGGDGRAIIPPTISPLITIAHVFGGNVYVGSLTDLPGRALTIDGTDANPYRNVAISPLGDQVAFVNPFAPEGWTLYAAPRQGSAPPRKLAEDLVAGYPVVWNPAGSEIAFLRDEGKKEGDKAIYGVLAVNAASGVTRKIGETLGVRIGCRSALADPADILYEAEAGPGGNSLMLAWARSGVLYYSLGCDGAGIGQITEAGNGREVVHPDLRRARMSFDETELLGLAAPSGDLVRLQLSDRAAVAIKTAAKPDQVAWSADGKTIFYTTFALKDTLILNDEVDRERGLKVFGVWPFQAKINEVTLRRLDLLTGEETELFKADGRGIPRMMPGPDGLGMLFTFTQNSALLVEAFRNKVSAAELKRQSPGNQLYWLPLPLGGPQLVAFAAQVSWGPMGSALAPTPTGGFGSTPNPGAPRPTLAVPPPTNTRQPTRTLTPGP